MVMESNQSEENTDKKKQPRSPRDQGLAEAIDASRSKYTETLAQAQRDKQARIEKAWSEYADITNGICAKAFSDWIDSYKHYVGAFTKLLAQPDDTAMQAVWSAWAEHIRGSQQSPETAKAIGDADQKLISALSEAEKACKETEESTVSAYSDSVDSVLSAHGLSRLDAAQAQLVVSEIVTRSV